MFYVCRINQISNCIIPLAQILESSLWCILGIYGYRKEAVRSMLKNKFFLIFQAKHCSFFYFDLLDLKYIFLRSMDLTASEEREDMYSQRFSSLLGKSKNVQRNCLGTTRKLFCVSGWSSFKLIYWIEMSAALCSF